MAWRCFARSRTASWCLATLLTACGGGGGGGGGAAPPPEELVTAGHTGPNGEDLREPITAGVDDNEPVPATTEDPADSSAATPGAPPGFANDTITIRSATFNAMLLDVDRAAGPVDPAVAQQVGAPGGDVAGRFPFRLMANQHIHVMGVQEVMLNTKTRISPPPSTLVAQEQAGQHALLRQETDGTYRLIRGHPVHQWSFPLKPSGGTRHRLQRTEYCPIIYDSNVLTCDGSDTVHIETHQGPTTTVRRSAHHVDCSVKSIPTQSFRFYCAHLPADAGRNVNSLPLVMALLATKPRVMIAADFNSNPMVAMTAVAQAWATGLGAQGTRYILPGGAFTKFNLRTGLPQWRKEASWRFLDDVLWSRSLDPHWLAPKWVLTFGKTLQGDQAWFTGYHQTVSDHVAVAADFKLWTGAP
jgi:hypothetical protein